MQDSDVKKPRIRSSSTSQPKKTSIDMLIDFIKTHKFKDLNIEKICNPNTRKFYNKPEDLPNDLDQTHLQLYGLVKRSLVTKS